MKNRKTIYMLIATIFTICIIAIFTYVTFHNEKEQQPLQSVAGAYVENNVQYIDIAARGGYFPKTVDAKANMQTVLKVTTTNTFDCSSALSIPKLNYHTNLPSNGTIHIDIPPQEVNTELQGTCAMGMYGFKITFK